MAVTARAALVLLAGCHGASGPINEHSDEARRTYPDLEALYAGAQGIYRGCGPNSGVCHSGNELPDLDTVGSVLDNLDRPCNQKRTSAEAVDDLCEPPGDRLAIAGGTIELAWAVPDGDGTSAAAVRRWRLGLREAPAAVGAAEQLAIVRDGLELWHLGRYATATRDPRDPKVLLLEALPAPPAPADARSEPAGRGSPAGFADNDPALVLATALAAAGVPAQPEAIRVGDPNRNGVFGAGLGGRLIKPGDPGASYLLHRLTDPAAGPLMPRANCCSWSLAAVRAMWCWIDGLEHDGRNAMAPIDYDACSPSPAVELRYPEPGPSCETAGLCPIGVAPMADDQRPLMRAWIETSVPSQ